jgi:hypothetical protein
MPSTSYFPSSVRDSAGEALLAYAARVGRPLSEGASRLLEHRNWVGFELQRLVSARTEDVLERRLAQRPIGLFRFVIDVLDVLGATGFGGVDLIII